MKGRALELLGSYPRRFHGCGHNSATVWIGIGEDLIEILECCRVQQTREECLSLLARAIRKVAEQAAGGKPRKLKALRRAHAEQKRIQSVLPLYN